MKYSYVMAWSYQAFRITCEDMGIPYDEAYRVDSPDKLRGIVRGMPVIIAIPWRNYPRMQDQRLMDELYAIALSREFDIIEHVMR